MSCLKQVIYNALYTSLLLDHSKPPLDFATEEDARDYLISRVMSKLFPEDFVGTVTVPTESSNQESPNKTEETKEETKEEVKKVKKAKASPKKSEEAKEAEKKAKEEAKEAEKKAKEEAKEAEKKAKEEAKEAEKKAKEEAKKAKASPKKSEDASNVPSMTVRWRKALKESADKEYTKDMESALLTFVNAMSNVAFHNKSVTEHVTDFLASRKVVEVVETDMEVVEFNGKDYYVNPETKRVYEGEIDEESGMLKVTKPVGYVGMAEFKDMVL